jgi:hypothetical protein
MIDYSENSTDIQLLRRVAEKNGIQDIVEGLLQEYWSNLRLVDELSTRENLYVNQMIVSERVLEQMAHTGTQMPNDRALAAIGTTRTADDEIALMKEWNPSYVHRPNLQPTLDVDLSDIIPDEFGDGDDA